MLQDILEQIENKVGNWLKEAGADSPVFQIERAASSDFGDYSTNAAMRYAKRLGKNPLQLAEELTDFIQKLDLEFIAKVDFVKPGFVNFYLTPEIKIQHLNDIREQGYGFGSNNKHKGEKWVIEHTSPNPNKAMHLGHLRNNLIGMGIVRLLKFAGAEVVSDAVYNNRGIAIAKVMYGYLAHMKKSQESPSSIEYWSTHKTEWLTPEEKDLKPDLFITECYVLAEKDFSGSPEVEQLVRQMVVDWEASDAGTLELWEHVLQLAYAGIDSTLVRIGSHWDKIWFEHEHYLEGKDYVMNGLKKGIFVELDDGAVLTNLEKEYNLPETILLKKDGTSLYITQDIALTDLKKKTYQADKLVWVIGPDQSMAMKQMFAVCEQLGIGRVEDFNHVVYGYVSLLDDEGNFQKMSSRAGTVVFTDEVIDTVKQVIQSRFEEEDKHEADVRAELSEKLAVAAVKFAFLKSDRTQELSFDIKQSVDVQGDSGIYAMYTYVRTQSILKKAADIDRSTTVIPSKLGTEEGLVRSLLFFEETVAKSTEGLSVHHIAQYILELTSGFNSWYAKETILDGGELEGYKLNLVEAVAITLRNGFSLLGIETVDKI